MKVQVAAQTHAVGESSGHTVVVSLFGFTVSIAHARDVTATSGCAKAAKPFFKWAWQPTFQIPLHKTRELFAQVRILPHLPA